MRLGIVSDIHCNAIALALALEMMGDVDELLCVGDSIYEYRFSNEVVQLLRQRQARMILGNHEAVFLGPHGRRARSDPKVDEGHVAFLTELPFTLQSRVNGKRLTMVHGSPWEPHNEYLTPGHPKLQRVADLETDILLMGHTHQAVVTRVGKALVINPGSCGEGRDLRYDRQLSFALLDTDSEEVSLRVFPDPSLGSASGETSRV